MGAVTLAWPNKSLSPNARVHFMAKHRAAKKAKDEAYWATKAVLPPCFKHNGKRTLIHVTFRPPDNRARDIDNAIASMKAAFDGLAAALGCDDSLFCPTFHWGAPVDGGQVSVELSPQFEPKGE